MVPMEAFLSTLEQDFPNISFKQGHDFHFHPPTTVFYPNRELVKYTKNEFKLLLLHEVGHAILHHKDYESAVDLLQIEAAAWEEAKKYIKKYHISWDEDFKDDRLDSYRDYLHKQSSCPRCSLNGYFSTRDSSYHCPNCNYSWH